MEGKIGDLGTARLVDPQRQSQMTKAPCTVVFMPPEALEDRLDIHYGKELDVFSFGCVMLHTLSYKWPTPLPAVVTDPETGVVKGGQSEVERRSKYFDRIDKSMVGVLIPLIESCLNNLPKKRASIMRMCDQLEDLVDRECVPIDYLTVCALQDEVRRKENELQRKNTEIQEIQRNNFQMQTEIQKQNTEIQEIQRHVIEMQTELQTKNTEIQSCVMLHTLSYKWPTPLPAVVTDPETGVVKGGQSEVERRSKYFDRIDKSMVGVLIPLIESCLNNLPKKRASIMRMCDQLEDLVDRECVPIDYLTVCALQDEVRRKENELQRKNTEIQEIQRNNFQMQTEIQKQNTEIQEIQRHVIEMQTELQTKNTEIQRKDNQISNNNSEMEALRSEMSKMQVTAPHVRPKQVDY